jgi:uncharacterized protein (UPF0548 family)
VTFTYPEVGATADSGLPAGYHHLRHRVRLRTTDLDAAAEAIITFAMHRATGARVTASAARAAPGVHVTVRLGLAGVGITAPCRVVWTVSEPDRAGFAYGTLPGHPERGEESFVVTREPGGSVEFEVTAFSRPATWYTRVAGPVVPLAQKLYARNLGRVLDRLCARA